VPSTDPHYLPEALLGRLVGRGEGSSEPSPGQSLGSKWFDARMLCSRGLGLLLCHWSFARRVALNLHCRRNSLPAWFLAINTSAEVESL
jgi:hypothetical protein